MRYLRKFKLSEKKISKTSNEIIGDRINKIKAKRASVINRRRPS